MTDKDRLDRDTQDLLDAEAIEEKQKRVLTRLLDAKLNQQEKYIAVRGHMGCINVGPEEKTNSVPSYSAMHSLDWVARRNILMGSEMDFMRNMIDSETGRVVVDEESAEEMKQRAPDWSRQAELTTYLVQENLRKFGTILAVISPAWIDEPKHENWGKDGRAIKSAATFEPLDSGGQLGLLDLSGTSVYALDGQHRVMGIRGVRELLEGGLAVKSKVGVVKKTIPKDEFLQRVGKDVSDLHRILTEEINVEYIPAVLLGETREEASRRVRSVFVAINSYAKKTEKGENILLSENDGFSIAARRVAHHSLLQTNEGGGRVDWSRSTIRAGDQVNVTTLATLRNAVALYNGHVTRFDWTPLFKGVLPLRPHEQELKELENKFSEFLDHCKDLPVFKRVAAGDQLDTIREFPTSTNQGGEGHLLVRPIGLPILADAVGRAQASQDLPTIFRKLAKFDAEGGFRASDRSSVFYGVTYDPANNKMKASEGSQRLAAKIVCYLLVGGSASEREEIEEGIRDARAVNDEEWMDVDRSIRRLDSDRFNLPHPIQL